MTAIAYRDRWTQDSVWYNSQPVFQEHGVEVTRETVKKYIKEICEEFGITREELGIFAGARATMYFNGEWSSVSFDAIGGLADNGTDVIITEKMALAQVLAPYAEKYGIALVSTSGYFTEYGIDLMQAYSDSADGHVVVITDYDMNGLHIAAQAPDMDRIGIDEETLDYFGLDKYDPTLSLAYKPQLKIRDFLDNYDDVIDRDFLEKRRVEIDAVLAAVGSERLWEYIMHKLTKLFPKRDYNRVIQTEPETTSPGAIGEIEDYVRYLKEKATEIRWEEIQEKELKDVEGFIDDVGAKRQQIEEELQKLVDTDARMKKIVSKFEELKTELKIDSDEEFAKYRKTKEATTTTTAVDEDDDSDSDSDEEADDT